VAAGAWGANSRPADGWSELPPASFGGVAQRSLRSPSSAPVPSEPPQPPSAAQGAWRTPSPAKGHVLAPAAALAGQGQITLAGLTSVLVPAHLVGPGAADDDVEEWHHRHSLIEAEEADLLSELLR